MKPVRRFFRRDFPDTRHHFLLADEELFCGDTCCNGRCGMARLVRVNDQGFVETANALLGVETVWSSDRWVTQGWKGAVVVVWYDGSEPYWA
jgi:hypothetical protein